MPVLTFAELGAAAGRSLPVLVELALRSLVVLSLAGVGTLVLRRSSAAARHWVWLLGMAGALALPAVWAVVPAWGLLPRIFEMPTVVESGVTGEGLMLPAMSERTFEPAITEIVTESHPAMVTAGPPPVTESVTSPVVEQKVASTPVPAAPAAIAPKAVVAGFRWRDLPWTTWLVLVWLSGAVVVLGHVILGNLSLWWLGRRCTRLTGGAWTETLQRLQTEMGVERPVILLVTNSRTMPMTWGIFRTRLLLPAEAEGWPAEQGRAVLMHELAHAKRRDCLTQFIAQLACAAYWFNPLVWVAWRRMQVERERACDDLVLTAGARASAYAEHLLQTASNLPPMRFIGGAAIAIARPSALEERLRAILDTHRNRGSLRAKNIVATLLLLALLIVPVACLRARQATPTVSAGTMAGAGAGAADGMLAYPLDAIIYEIRLPSEKITQWDPEVLKQQASDPDAFEKALSALGKVRPSYRMHQQMQLADEIYIQMSNSVPYITSSQISNTGQTVNSVAYTDVGAIFNMIAKAGPAGQIEVQIAPQVSTLGGGGIQIRDNVRAPVFEVFRAQYHANVQVGRPFVLTSTNGGALDSDGNAVMYVWRVTIGAPVTETPAP